MYESHFGLKKNPFLTTPDPDLHLLTTRHREALAALSYAIVVRKGLAVLCGEAGTGKTTLVRKLMQVSTGVRAHTSVIFNPLLTPAEFLEMLLLNFGAPEVPANKTQRLLMLDRMLRTAAEQRRTAVLIVDEAHTLSPQLLEEIRLLTNFETSEHKLIQIVLAGHPELNQMLNRQEFWHVKQRVAVRVEVGSLSFAELQQYITYRWNKSSDGTQPVPFTAESMSRVAHWSRGIPRLINVICDNALVLAFAAGDQTIAPVHIDNVAQNLELRAATVAPPPALAEPLKRAIASEPHEPLPDFAKRNGSDTTARNNGTPAIVTAAVAPPVMFGTLGGYSAEQQKTSLSRRWAAWLKG
jgi:general secretion pathway protein A